MKNYYVYILFSSPKGVLYVGVTNNLVKRIYEHRQRVVEGFTKKYKVTKLAYYEIYDSIELAISCEKLFKKWNRDWKIQLIERSNPQWKDLYGEIIL
jgi:putative endonuclease